VRRQRADARRSRAAVLDAAVTLLGRNPDASMEEIARAAGVARQTVYAHFPSRESLLHAAVDQITAAVVATLDAVDVSEGSAAAALRRWLDTSWGLLERYPVLLSPAMPSGDAPEEDERHRPITNRLRRLVRRGQRAGEFDGRLSPAWLVAATIALGHAAGQEVSAGRMSSRQAGDAFRESVLRVCVAQAPGRSAPTVGAHTG
jgi:AcrR family transcriptional regulator